MSEAKSPLVIDRSGEIVVATLQRRHLSGQDMEGLQADFRQLLLDLEVKDVVIDFRNVSYFGTEFLNQVVVFYRAIRQRDGRLALCNLGANREILLMIRFDRIMTIAADLPEAIAALQAGPTLPADSSRSGEETAG